MLEMLELIYSGQRSQKKLLRHPSSTGQRPLSLVPSQSFLNPRNLQLKLFLSTWTLFYHLANLPNPLTNLPKALPSQCLPLLHRPSIETALAFPYPQFGVLLLFIQDPLRHRKFHKFPATTHIPPFRRLRYHALLCHAQTIYRGKCGPSRPP